jgi:hypothetical protein
MKTLPWKAKLLVGVAVVSGLTALSRALVGWEPVHDYPKFLAYLLVAVVAARLRVSLPRMSSSMAVNLPVILIAVIDLSLPEAFTVAAVSTFVQAFWTESGKRSLVRVAYNVSVVVLAAQSMWLTLRLGFHNLALGITAGAFAVLLTNTLPVAAIIALTEADRVTRIWVHIVQLTFPYYGLAAGVAGLAKLADRAVGWKMPLFILPALFLFYRSYAFYFRQIGESAVQVRVMSAKAGAV